MVSKHLRNVYRNMIFISLVGYTMESFKFLGEGRGQCSLTVVTTKTTKIEQSRTLLIPHYMVRDGNCFLWINEGKYTEKNFYYSHYNIGMLPKQQLNRWNTETKPQNDKFFNVRIYGKIETYTIFKCVLSRFCLFFLKKDQYQ